MITTLILFFIISIVASLLCSLWESVLLSVPLSYVQQQLDKNHIFAKKLAHFKENIDQPLAAVLTLNTIAHTIGAIGVGHQASIIWADSQPIITSFIVPVVMTLCILIISEIIPKTLGASEWKKFATFTVAGIDLTIKILWPLVWACQQITSFMNQSKKGASISRQDFLALLKIGSQEGQIDIQEATFIQNLMKLRHTRLSELMTPRVVMLYAPETMSIESFYKKHRPLTFSRIPIHAAENPDDITGFILKSDIMSHLFAGNGDACLSSIQRPIMSKPKFYPAFKLFNEFTQKRQHIAVIVDEHGAVVGLVSLEDILEEVLGQEIVDETDTVVDLRTHAKQIDKFKYD